MPPFLTGLAAKALFLLGVAAVVAFSTGWLVHKIDDDKYKALQLADANALNEQLVKDQAATQAFNERAATALEATAGKLKILAAQRVNQTQNLINTFTAEGMKDASLASCLAMPLPADVLRQLTH